MIDKKEIQTLCTNNKCNNKKTIICTPFEKFKKRVSKEFIKRKYIGDICVNEEEYDILIEHFIKLYNQNKSSYSHIVSDDILFALALVQIGIKYYDGSYWPHVAENLKINQINPSTRTWIGEIYIMTLRKYNKFMINSNEIVNNIMLHCFVSDFYANDLFNFLFAYYRIDLERDLLRNDKETMNSLINVIVRYDKTGRTYLLVKQTEDAIRANVRGSKIRIRHLLKLIDKCFWYQENPRNLSNRFNSLFYKWQQNTKSLNEDYSNFVSGCSSSVGKKIFSTPYIKCNLQSDVFELVLPSQLLKLESLTEIYWKISINNNLEYKNVELYGAVTGYKTNEINLNLEKNNLFDEIKIELLSDENRFRLFKINHDNIRFFDKEGYNIKTNLVPYGEAYSYTKFPDTPLSEALVINENIRTLIKSYFIFENGDIVRLPEGNMLSIGKKNEEGLLSRGVIDNCYINDENTNITIYRTLPSILVKIQKSKLNGTLIIVNKKRFNMFDSETIEVDLNDRSGETGYIISLKKLGFSENGIYEIYIDVPNDRTNRFWKFAYIDGFNYEFEDAPYIFSSRGTIKFADQYALNPIERGFEKVSDENAYNFKINSIKDRVKFNISIKNEKIEIYFEIPVFAWKSDDGEWYIDQPIDLWYNKFPTKLFLKFPDDKVTICIDDDNISEGFNQSVVYNKIKSSNIFECDVTCFKSWINREKLSSYINLNFSNNKIEFLKTINKSIVSSQLLTADYEKKLLIGKFNIIGESSYYVDIEYCGRIIVDKLKLDNCEFVVNEELDSGIYKIKIYENDEDDFGFENYFLIDQYEKELLNPYDLTGKTLILKYLKNINNNVFNIRLDSECLITEFVRTNDLTYFAHMYGEGLTSDKYEFINVEVVFKDVNNINYCHIKFEDNGDYLEFLYDSLKKQIVREEIKYLKRTEKYRRYEVVFEDEFTFLIDFISDKKQIESLKSRIRFKNSIINKLSTISQNKIDTTISVNKIKIKTTENEKRITIEEVKFSKRTYNCIKRAGLRTLNDLEKLNYYDLLKIRNLGKNNINEINNKLYEYGYKEIS